MKTDYDLDSTVKKFYDGTASLDEELFLAENADGERFRSEYPELVEYFAFTKSERDLKPLGNDFDQMILRQIGAARTRRFRLPVYITSSAAIFAALVCIFLLRDSLFSPPGAIIDNSNADKYEEVINEETGRAFDKLAECFEIADREMRHIGSSKGEEDALDKAINILSETKKNKRKNK